MTTAATTDEATRVLLEAWLVTDVGVVRDHNEDSAYMAADRGFFIVADGMGGHAAGEVASAMAVETVKKTLEEAQAEIESFKKAPSDAGRRALVQLLQSAVLQAHQAVYQRGQTEPDKQGMGTTLDVVLVAGAEAFVAHVGDSRTYLVRDGRSSQITTDHTVAEVLVIEGKLTIEEAQVSPLRTILVNAIGVSADVGVEMAHVTLKRGDRILLCSDGLHDYFPVEEEIAQRISAEKPGDALKEMVELAKTRGGHDNITGVAVLVSDLHEGVPSTISSDSTQPVDLTGNPFASDEPTQTAAVPPPPKPVPSPLDAGGLKHTQPMRAMPDGEDMGSATTLPPPMNDKPADTKADKKKSAKPDKKSDAKTDGKTDAKTDGEKKDAAKPEPDDAVPTQPIATADTGPAKVQPESPKKS
ncbi:MAG: serine/threonine-protein phosphatase [Deltaproteobacteria bacterium]|nr:serine/threonine-protein phosphatase [Deltaproteobacteria bacterium]